jgi:hypothetical protein
MSNARKGRIAGLLPALLLFARCASITESTHVTFQHANGTRAAEGRRTRHESIRYVVAALEKKEPPAWTQYYRVGTWRYWYPDGSLRAVVRYRLGSYTECCVAGHCPGIYERLVGKPELYDRTGRPVTLRKAAGTACRQTNCTQCERVAHPRYILPDDLAPEWSTETDMIVPSDIVPD